MVFPTRTLQAAGRWLSLLRTGPYSQAKSFIWNDAGYADLSRDQYDRGFKLLTDLGVYDPGVGLRKDLRGISAVQLSLALAVEVVSAEAPPWIADAVIEDAVIDPPAEVLWVASALELDVSYASEVARRAFGKVDLESRAVVGAAGESALASLLLQSGAEMVEQVSAYDDGAGYDLRVSVDGVLYHLEVKSTTKKRSLRVFLSRNEFEVFTRDPSWNLVVVGLDDEKGVAALASVKREVVMSSVPLDNTVVGRWSSCQLILSNTHLTRGLQLGSIELRGHSSSLWWP